MRKLKKILVIIEPQQMRQTALERALALVQAAGKGQHHIIAVLPIEDVTKASDPQDASLKGEDLEVAVKTRARRWLHSYLSIHAMNIEIDERVMVSKTLGRDLVKLCHEEGIDLIIKHHEEHGLLDGVLTVPLDLQLLRHAPAPVLVSRDHIWHPTGIIALALDFYDPENAELRQLNMRLLREAQELSHLMHCDIHIVNAIAPILPPATLDLPGFAPEMMGDEALKEGCRAVLDFASRHKIPSSHCHIREGLADEVIPNICAELKPTALFIGTSARKGLSGALVGNICERVTDALDCDVAVITPKAVIERTPRVL